MIEIAEMWAIVTRWFELIFVIDLIIISVRISAKIISKFSFWFYVIKVNDETANAPTWAHINLHRAQDRKKNTQQQFYYTPSA